MSQSLQHLRAFVGVPLPEAVDRPLEEHLQSIKATLTRTQRDVDINRKQPVRWVAKENRHMTLNFLGPLSPDTVPKLKGQLRRALTGCGAFDAQLSGICGFPDAKSHILAAVAEPSAAFDDLFERVQAGCEALELPREHRRFKPHITLARSKRKHGFEEVHSELSLHLRVDRVNIYESRLTPHGSQYTVLASLPLLS